MKKRPFSFLAFLILLVGLLCSFLLWWSFEQKIKEQQKIFFLDLAVKTQKRILSRMQTYLDAHQAAVGLFQAVDSVTKNQWQTFVNAQNLGSSYPGINGLGYAVSIPKPDSAVFLEQARQEIASDFKIKSHGLVPDAKQLYIIKYIVPLERNIKAIGFDMGSEPLRRAAMEKARDNLVATISGKLTLVQDTARNPGFLMYVPVYVTDPETGLNTRFKGWVYSAFIAENFVEGVLKYEFSKASQYFNFELYDGPENKPENLLYASWEPGSVPEELIFKETVPVLGNNWTFVITASGRYRDMHSHTGSRVILATGILLSFLLFFLINNLANTRRRAMEIAEKMTLELRTLNQELDKKVAERTLELEGKNKELINNSEKLRIAYEDLELKVKYRNLQLEKQVKALQEENEKLKGLNG